MAGDGDSRLDEIAKGVVTDLFPGQSFHLPGIEDDKTGAHGQPKSLGASQDKDGRIRRGSLVRISTSSGPQDAVLGEMQSDRKRLQAQLRAINAENASRSLEVSRLKNRLVDARHGEMRTDLTRFLQYVLLGWQQTARAIRNSNLVRRRGAEFFGKLIDSGLWGDCTPSRCFEAWRVASLCWCPVQKEAVELEEQAAASKQSHEDCLAEIKLLEKQLSESQASIDQLTESLEDATAARKQAVEHALEIQCNMEVKVREYEKVIDEKTMGTRAEAAMRVSALAKECEELQRFNKATKLRVSAFLLADGSLNMQEIVQTLADKVLPLGDNNVISTPPGTYPNVMLKTSQDGLMLQTSQDGAGVASEVRRALECESGRSSPSRASGNNIVQATHPSNSRIEQLRSRVAPALKACEELDCAKSADATRDSVGNSYVQIAETAACEIEVSTPCRSAREEHHSKGEAPQAHDPRKPVQIDVSEQTPVAMQYPYQSKEQKLRQLIHQPLQQVKARPRARSREASPSHCKVRKDEQQQQRQQQQQQQLEDALLEQRQLKDVLLEQRRDCNQQDFSGQGKKEVQSQNPSPAVVRTMTAIPAVSTIIAPVRIATPLALMDTGEAVNMDKSDAAPSPATGTISIYQPAQAQLSPGDGVIDSIPASQPAQAQVSPGDAAIDKTARIAASAAAAANEAMSIDVVRVARLPLTTPAPHMRARSSSPNPARRSCPQPGLISGSLSPRQQFQPLQVPQFQNQGQPPSLASSAQLHSQSPSPIAPLMLHTRRASPHLSAGAEDATAKVARIAASAAAAATSTAMQVGATWCRQDAPSPFGFWPQQGRATNAFQAPRPIRAPIYHLTSAGADTERWLAGEV